ncbi:MAG: methyltransferase [Magnetococcales bacterium]|nr:methyltransferase [Magnetococcales bacterium]
MNPFQGVPKGLCRRVGGGVEGRLLAARIQGKPGTRMAELGCGCGEISIRVALSNPGVTVDALEVQTELCDQARQLIDDHGVNTQVRVIPGDLRFLPACMPAGHYARVFCNPPFFSPRSGRLPPEAGRAAARFELLGGMEDFIQAGAGLLQPGGDFDLIHRPERLPEILNGCVTHGLQPIRLIPVQARPESAAILVLINARKENGGQSLILAPPIVLPNA